MIINTAKLSQIRDDYAKQRDLFMGLTARARQAKIDALQLRTYSPAITATPAQRELAGRVLALPPTELLKLPPEVLQTLGLTPAFITRGIEAQRRVDTLQREADSLLSELHSRGALLTKFNEFARGKL